MSTPAAKASPALAALLVLWSQAASAVNVESELLAAEGEAMLAVGDAPGAVDLLEQALAVDEDNERARLLLARALVATGDTDGALEHVETLLEAHPGDPALLREQGYIMLMAGDEMWAAQALKQAVAEDPDDELAQLYLGWLALSLEVPEDAVEPLSQASASGDVGATALYLAALALERSGRPDAALTAIEAAAQAGLVSDPWRRAASDLQTSLERRVIPFPIVDVGLSASLQYDSNVALFTQDLAELAGGSYDSFGAVLAGSTMIRPLRGRTWALGGGGSILQTFNFERRVQAFNTTVYGVTVEMVKLFDDLPLRRIRLRYLQSLVCLWGGELVDFDRYYRFSNSYGADLTTELEEGDWGLLRLRMLWRYALFTDYGRDNMGFVATLNQTFLLWERRVKLALEASIRVEHADDPAWNQVSPRLFTGVSVLVPGEVQLMAGFAYEREDHLHSGRRTRWGRHRVDDVLVYNTGVSRTFLDQLTVGASFGYTDNRSTLVTTYDYDRWVVSLTLSWRKK